MLGSVLEDHKFESSISHTVTPFEAFPHRESVAEKRESRSFRKNSESKVEEVSESPISVKVPQRISYIDFQVQRLLGNGAFGKVYLAIYRPDGKDYALKVLNKKKLFAKTARISAGSGDQRSVVRLRFRSGTTKSPKPAGQGRPATGHRIWSISC